MNNFKENDILQKKIKNQELVISDLQKENNTLNHILHENQNKIVDNNGKF